MAWTSPNTVATGDFITAAMYNTYVRDNTTDLDRRTTTGSALVGTSETRTSTSYGDLATVGPSVVLVVGGGGKALVSIMSNMLNNTASAECYMGVAVSGGTTVAADDSKALRMPSPVASGAWAFGCTYVQESLNAGSNTFTAKYRVSAGTGTWLHRRLQVVPLGS